MVSVVVTGYLLHAICGKRESCNCSLTGEGMWDWHLNLVSKQPSFPAKSENAMKKPVVAEITPRITVLGRGASEATIAAGMPDDHLASVQLAALDRPEVEVTIQ